MAKERVTVVDIARAAGVSKSTVSLVLQGSPAGQRGDPRQGQRGHPRARLRLQSRRGQPAPVQCQVEDHRHGRQRPDQQLLRRTGRRASTGRPVGRLRPVPRQYRRKRRSPARGHRLDARARHFRPDHLAGARHGGRRPEASGGQRHAGRRSPSATSPGAKVSTVMSDNHAGAHAAAAHLVELGHRRIAFLGGFADTAVFDERLRGYRDALLGGGPRRRRRAGHQSAPSRAGGVDAIGRAMLAGRTGRRRRSASTTPSPSASATACERGAWSRARILPSSASTT